MRQRGFVLIPIFLIITLAATLGYLAYHNLNLQKKNINSTIKLPTPFTTQSNVSSTPDPTIGYIDKENIFTSKFYGFSIKFPANLKPYFNENTVGTHVLYATDELNKVGYSIFIAKKGLSNLPGPTGFGAGQWENDGYFSMLGQKLEKSALTYEGNISDVMYQTSNERSIIFPNTDTVFLFLINADYNNGGFNLPPSAEVEFEKILSTFKFIE